jgi:hypothetical protein
MMKSRTLMELSQSPGWKSLQQSPALASVLRAALVFMMHLPLAWTDQVGHIGTEGDNSACTMTIVATTFLALI